MKDMKFKRFLSAVLGLCMMQTFAMPKISAESNKITISVVYDENEEKAACYLEGLGIDTDFKNAEFITRGQFTSIIMKLAYNNEFVASGEKVFKDVTEDCEYYNDIYYAYSESVVSKSEFFRPDDNILYEEAVTMATTILGYGFVARKNGGFPYGYTKCASDIGINKNISNAINKELSGREVMLLLYNMLDAEFMLQNFQDGRISYSISDNSSILTDIYKLEKIKGVVTSTVYSDLSGVSTVADNKIKIDGRLFEYDGDASDLLGMNVVAYVNEDDKAVIICPENNKILKADKVESYSNSILKIENGNSSKTVKLDGSFCFVYNGVAYPDYDDTEVSDNDFTNFEGYIKLLDNNNDGQYDVVFIYDVEYMKVSQIDKLNKKIYGKSVSWENICYDEDSHIRFYDSETEINPMDIKVDSMLAIMLSKDGKVGRVEVINNEVYGMIERLDDEYIYIDGIEYKRSNHLNTYYSPVVGTMATFNLGILDDVVMITMEESREYRYGYLVKAIKNSETDTYILKIFTEDGEIKKYDVAEKVNLNGIGIRQYKDWATSAEPLTDAMNVTQRQLIRYKVSEGLITAIDTVSDAVSENALDQATDSNKDSLLRYFNQASTQYYTVNNIYTFQKFNVASQTIIFSVPEPSAIDVLDEDFSIKALDSFKKDSSYTVDAYDLDKNGVAGVVLLYDSDSSSLADSKEYGTVDSISDVYHDDLGVCKKVTLWKGGERYSYYMENDERNLHMKDANTPLTTGDVVHIFSKNGVIKDMEVIFDVDKMELTSNGVAMNGGKEDKTQTSRAFTVASLYKMTDKYFIVTRQKTDGIWDYGLNNLRYIPLYNDAGVIVVENKKVKKIYSDEFLDYCSAGGDADELFLVQGYWGLSDIVVYR